MASLGKTILVAAAVLIAVWGGCRMAVTAEKLEASAEIYPADYHIGQDAPVDRD